MKILLTTNYQPPHMGGIEYAALSLKSSWLRLGHEVAWLTTDIPRGAAPSTTDNIRIPSANFPERLWQINSPVIDPFRIPAINRALDWCDVVNIHSLAPGLSAVVLYMALLRRKPVVATQHVGVIPLSNRVLDAVQKEFLCRVAKWGAGKGMKLTFVGQAVRDWFVENAGLDAGQIAMTPAGYDHDVYFFVPDDERRALRAKWQVDPARLNILFVGRFYEKKGLALIRQAARDCPDARFTLVGRGPVVSAAWNLENIKVIEFVSNAELRELYGVHDLFIMPSVGEGWPAVVPQAMACGLPCLISEETFAGYGKDREMFIVCQRDPEILRQALLACVDDLGALYKRRESVAQYARATWDWERTAEIYINLFGDLLRLKTSL